MRFQLLMLFLSFLPALAAQTPDSGRKPVRVAIAGLVHGHVDGFLRPVKGRTDVALVGIYEPNTELQRKYAKRFGLADSLFFSSLPEMLDRTKPDAVATFTNTRDHAMVVETCAPRHLVVMMEKPMAVSNEHARRIQAAVRQYGIPLIVNYETSWYPSHGAIYDLFKQRNAAGAIRKMVAMDGHAGPQEINVGPEFLAFLNDPEQNGAGALFDFGCYGANLMTWMMDNQRPLSVMALTQHDKPSIYPKVDDEATILVEYPQAQGIIQGSWNWPFSRKDFEVYGATGYAIATGGNVLHVRLPGGKEESPALQPLPAEQHDPLSYLLSVVHGAKPSGLSSLENNMIVVEILDAARESARTGRKVVLTQKRP